MSILLDKTIRLFLDSIGRREEYEYYLERFTLDGQSAFAVVVPAYAGFSESASVFVFDVSFLLRLGLHPVVLLCGPHSANMRMLLAQDGHPFTFIEVGIRNAAEREALPARLEKIADSGKVAVVVDPGIAEDEALSMIVPYITRRIHFIRASGPLHDVEGRPLSYYQTKAPIPLLAADQSIAEVASRVTGLAEGLHVSIASPLDLLAELFTVKGAGCLVRRGAHIHQFDSTDDIDLDRFIALLQNSFGRMLLLRDCFDEATCIFVDEEYRCGAVLVPYLRSMYLSKFAVHQDARGEGLAQELWQRITSVYPALCWRSRVRNPFNHWYDKKSDGVHTEGGWRVYWRGISRADIPAVIDSCLQRPLDFAPVEDEDAHFA